jgi:NAD-dependent DNA ligase
MSVAKIVATLKEASAAYYNGGPLTMSDDAFDALLEKLRGLDPANPFLTTIGAPPTASVTRLPYAMPSLDKIKPGQDALVRFLAATGPFVVSEKLDGLSALWIPGSQSLYLRGDGIDGQDISHLAPLGIKGLVAGPPGIAVRGELVVPRTTVATLSRSWVNGIIHRKDATTADVSKIHFVAYDLLAPAFSRSHQFTWLASHGYETCWHTNATFLNVETLKAHLLTRRETSAYDTDGIVVGIDAVPQRPAAGKNPKDAVAFKMPLAEQSAETVVKEVIWAPSAQGYLIPKLEFEPVVINGATIKFCTAHTARTVFAAGLGPGSRVVIRRSGDVIPTIDRVLTRAPGGAQFPPDGTWEWVSTEDATHIRATAPTAALVTAKLHHFLRVLDVPGVGPAAAAALVEGGIIGPLTLWRAPATRLSELLGPKTGVTLFDNLRNTFGSNKLKEIHLMVASSTMPRGVGDTKLQSLTAVDADPRRWCDIQTPPAGWTADSLTAFQVAFPAYEAWRRAEMSWLPYPILGGASVATAAATATSVATATAQKGTICLTGFRDKTLEERATAAGFTVAAAVTGKTTMLLVPDGEVAETEKVKGARAKGIRILTRTAFTEQYLR